MFDGYKAIGEIKMPKMTGEDMLGDDLNEGLQLMRAAMAGFALTPTITEGVRGVERPETVMDAMTFHLLQVSHVSPAKSCPCCIAVS